MPDAAFLTAAQEKWFAALRDGLERDTGRSLATWVELAKACPETAHRKRLAWMKQEHGLGQNRASIVLQAAFPPDIGWSKPEALADALWADPAARAIHKTVHETVMRLPEIVVGQRKGYTAYSRHFQFCAIRQHRNGAILGLALDPANDPALQPPSRQPWSERLAGTMLLPSIAAIPGNLHALLKLAWESS